MKILDKDNLVNYLYRVYDFEKTIFQQKEIIKSYERQISNINFELKRQPSYEEVKYARYSFGNAIMACVILIVVLLGFLFLCSKTGLSLIEKFDLLTISKVSEITQELELAYRAGWLRRLIEFMAILTGILVIYELYQILKNKREVDEYNDYVREVIENNEALHTEWQNKTIQMSEKIKQLTSESNRVGEEMKKTENALQVFYSVDVLYPKYRNIKAVYALLEYLCSGRCSELQGHEGAYNLYEEDLRFERINERLDIISEQIIDLSDDLNIIQDNQNMQYEAIMKSNRMSEKMIQQAISNGRALNNIQSNASLIQYNQNRSQQRLESIEWLERQRYIWGGR